MSDIQTPPKIKPAKSETERTQPDAESVESNSEPAQSETESAKTKLEKLLAQRKELEKLIKTEQVNLAAKNRKREARIKILIGAAIQKRISAGKLTQEWLDAILEAELLTKHDRKVFGLPPLPETTATAKT